MRQQKVNATISNQEIFDFISKLIFLLNTQFTYRSFFNKVPYSKTEFQYRNIQSNSLKTLDLEKTSILKIDKSPRISF